MTIRGRQPQTPPPSAHFACPSHSPYRRARQTPRPPGNALKTSPTFDAGKTSSAARRQSMTSEVKKTPSMDRAGVRARLRDEAPASLLLADLFRTAKI